jgi:ADP-ribosylglycohydrolase
VSRGTDERLSLEGAYEVVAEDFLDAVYGCLIGGAIGDAMGAPVENWHFEDIREEYGKVDRFLPGHRGITTSGEPGAITDDSALRHYMCLAVVRKGGRITPDDYARVWLEDLNPNRLFYTERIVLEKLKLGMNPWETGRGQLPADAAIMAIAPVGIINAGDPTQAYQDAFCLASIHQDGLERDAAATAAAGFAEAFSPGASAQDVLEAMEEHATQEVGRLVFMALELARGAGRVERFVEAFYDSMLDRSFPVSPGEGWVKDRSPAPTSARVSPSAALPKGPASAGMPTRSRASWGGSPGPCAGLVPSARTGSSSVRGQMRGSSRRWRVTPRPTSAAWPNGSWGPLSRRSGR